MSRQETMTTTIGEMRDMISCITIYNGGAQQKTKRKFSFDEAMNLR